MTYLGEVASDSHLIEGSATVTGGQTVLLQDPGQVSEGQTLNVTPGIWLCVLQPHDFVSQRLSGLKSSARGLGSQTGSQPLRGVLVEGADILLRNLFTVLLLESHVVLKSRG